MNPNEGIAPDTQPKPLEDSMELDSMTEFETMIYDWVVNTERSLPPLKGVKLDTEIPTGYLITCYPVEDLYENTTLTVYYSDLFLWLYWKVKAAASRELG